MSPAHADEYPSRAIKIVSPHPPGVATDVLGRALAVNLQHSLGQPVVVENRPGANGIVDLWNSGTGTTDLVVDISGYYDKG